MSRNITVDDQNGDPSNGYQIIYEPKDAWISNGIGGCPNCTMPNSNRPFMKHMAWNGSVPINASFAFFGADSSRDSVFIKLNAEFNGSGFIEMTFDIDGVRSGNFSHSPKGTGNDYNFNNVVFASQQLSLQNHSLTIHNGFVGGPTSLVILDSITYTTEDVASASQTPIKTATGVSSNNSSRTLQVGPARKMVLAVLLPVLVVACIALLWLFVRRRRLSRRSAPAQKRQPSRSRGLSGSIQLCAALGPAQSAGSTSSRNCVWCRSNSWTSMNSSGCTPAPRKDIRSQLDGARERNNQLLTRIHELEAQLESAWALGLSDEPPPGYSARESLT
ncbi:hypothetical protein B0H14DRAFT_2790061 [Mycena olivaceomarginata]|nr:hypothetical protein B0H14DRAFT_2790061 [Mycena olivaceomarginata]